MAKLSDRLDEISRTFFSVWHTWRTEEGWTLGPDTPDLKMSPWLVERWERLTPDGQAWFRQHVALVLFSIGEKDVEETAEAPSAPLFSSGASEKYTKVWEKTEVAVLALKRNRPKVAHAALSEAIEILTTKK